MIQKSYDETAAVYLIPTPIGNMEDMTYRAINTLKKVDVIFSEDTRVTSLLLKELDIKKPLISNHEFNEEKNRNKIIKLLEENKNIGIVTDRGTPVISDPGYGLAEEAIKKGYNVVGLPGPTALIPALIASGISPSPFLFYGFLKNKGSKRKKELDELKQLKYTLIFYESPHRIKETLEDMLDCLGNRVISISREISKKFEEIIRGNISDVLKELATIKGEFVIVVEGCKEKEIISQCDVSDIIETYIKEGKTKSDAIKMAANDLG